MSLDFDNILGNMEQALRNALIRALDHDRNGFYKVLETSGFPTHRLPEKSTPIDGIVDAFLVICGTKNKETLANWFFALSDLYSGESLLKEATGRLQTPGQENALPAQSAAPPDDEEPRGGGGRNPKWRSRVETLIGQNPDCDLDRCYREPDRECPLPAESLLLTVELGRSHGSLDETHEVVILLTTVCECVCPLLEHLEGGSPSPVVAEWLISLTTEMGRLYDFLGGLKRDYPPPPWPPFRRLEEFIKRRAPMVSEHQRQLFVSSLGTIWDAICQPAGQTLEQMTSKIRDSAVDTAFRYIRKQAPGIAVLLSEVACLRHAKAAVALESSFQPFYYGSLPNHFSSASARLPQNNPGEADRFCNWQP